MANRMTGNVIILDSAAGNAFIQAVITTSGTSNMNQYAAWHVNAIALWASDSTGKCVITTADTRNAIAVLGFFGNGPAYISTQFGQHQPLDTLKIPTLTAGTAWIYLT